MFSRRVFSLLIVFSPPAFSQEPTVNDLLKDIQSSIDLVWVVTAGVLVFLMQAGFGLLESGMSRSKNSVNVIMKNYLDLCVGSLIYFVLGFGLMFGTNSTGWFGEDHFLFSSDAGDELAFAFFQTMFAATAVTIMSGAMAERTKFGAYLLSSLFICAVIYPVYGSWVWGSFYDGTGWLSALGFIDFAGSTVVHSVGAWCALAGILVIGPRLGRFKADGSTAFTIPAHNMMYVALGGFILWFGWFGFNAGSTLAAGDDIGVIVYNTQLAAAAGAVGVLLISMLTGTKLLASRTINGSLAGLVGITAGCASMTPLFAIATGFIASVVYLWGERFLVKRKIDDVVGAVPVHGFCGVWGTLAAGLFYADDMFSMEIIATQLIGIVTAFLWVFPIMYLFFKIIDAIVGLRASTEQELQGLDFSEHHEQAYPEFQQNTLFHKE